MTSSIFEPTMIIGGKPHTPVRPRLEFSSPSTGEMVTSMALGTAEDVDIAVSSARKALPLVAGLTHAERADLLDITAQRLQARAEEIADILALEHGKPSLTEAMGEVSAAAEALKDAGAQARWLTESHYPLGTPGKRLLTVRRPRGVYGILTPWNFPLGIMTQYYLGPGLAGGNTLVWLGAPSVNAVHSVLAEIVADVWPAGTLNFLTGEGPVVGQAIASHKGIDAVGFTGSTRVGLEVHRASVGKPSFLEMGGNGPTIVLADADIERAAERIASGSFTNAGQICTSTGRILADQRIASQLAEALAAESKKFVLGDPRHHATTMGPVHQYSLAERVLKQVNDAVAAGAGLLTGGRRLEDAPTAHYILPTVVDHVPADQPLHIEETFGPVAPVIHFSAPDELDDLLRASEHGLHAGIFTRDVEKALTLGETLRVGHVNINDTSAYWEPSIPAGGAAGAASGVGRAGGPWSVHEMTEVQTFTIEHR